MENTNWIREIGYREGIEVLCFDDWNNTGDIDVAWTVTIPEEDLEVIWDEMDSGYRRHGLAGVTQDCLANYDSEFFDIGTTGFDLYLGETRRGEWIPEEKWIEENYRNR